MMVRGNNNSDLEDPTMKKSLVLTIAFIVTFTTGCELESRRANVPVGHPCYNKEGDAAFDCLENQEAQKNLKKIDDRPNAPKESDVPATTDSAAPDVKPSDVPELPVWNPLPPPRVPPNPPGVSRTSATTNMFVTADMLPQGDNGCMPGQNVSLHNNSKKRYFMELSADGLRPCGDANYNGLVPIYGGQGNGSQYVPMVIPPGKNIGAFYFYPWRSEGGMTVSTNGEKHFTIRVYDAGSLKGLTPATPAAPVVILHGVMSPPFDDIWWKLEVSDEDIRLAKLGMPTTKGLTP